MIEPHVRLESSMTDIIITNIEVVPGRTITQHLGMVQGNTVKIMGWYDNEAGYSNRVADLIIKIG